ncbi:hypothetical protein JCM19992_17350 [Thermostilla marina]
MDKKFYTTDEAAKILGLTPAEVNAMRERNELRGFRDGMDWKFKVEDVEALVRQRRQDVVSSSQFDSNEGEKAPSETDEIVLMGDDLSTLADSEASGTVIGSSNSAEGEGVSDIKLGGSDLDLLDEGDFASVEMDAKVNGFGESQEVGDAEPLELEAAEAGDSPEELDLAADTSGEAAESKPDSSVDLSPGSEKLEDDDLVLGGSGSGSDITLSGDSGISLLDSNDSGISLEDPLELAPVDDSLELGEDDILTIAEDVDTESPTQLKTDDEFLLTPLEEVSEDESASGSQVIALDTDVPVDVAGAGAQPAGVLGGMQPPAAPGGMPEMPAAGAGPIPPTPGMEIPQPAIQPAAAQPEFAPQPGGPVAQPAAYGAAAAPAEAPWGTLWVTMLIICAVLLILCGMMCFDLLRNMWSWQGPYSLNSTIMDAILEMLP